MKTINESLHGGLVTSSHPTKLSDGECSAGANGWFMDTCDSVVAAPTPLCTQLVASGIIDGGSIRGMTLLQFHDGTERLLMQTNGLGFNLASFLATANATGFFTGLTSLGIPGTELNGHTVVAHNNRYVLLTGRDENYVLRKDLTTRRLGLKPVTTPVTNMATATAGSNTWPANATGYFDYWYTEAAELGGDPEDIIIESAYEATSSTADTNTTAGPVTNMDGSASKKSKMAVGTVFVGGLDAKVTMDLPSTPKNSTATHYYIYRSQNKALPSDASFPLGQRVGRIAIPASPQGAYLTFVDGASITDATYFYPAAGGVGPITNCTWANTGDAIKNNLTEWNDETMYATMGTNTPDLTPRFGEIEASQFGIEAAITAEIFSALNIQVKLKRNASYPNNFSNVVAQISFDGTTWTSATHQLHQLSVGTDFDVWETGWATFGYPNLTRTDIANLNVRVVFTLNSSFGNVASMRLFGMRVQVKHGGTDIITTEPYPGITITQGEDTFVASRGGVPPKANLGCVFNGALVTNDTTKPNVVRWSVPGIIDSFPALYYVSIQGGSVDEITYITTINNVCVIGLKHALVRLNYLPTEDDSSFGRDRIWDYIDTRHGVANRKGATKITTPEGKELLVFAAFDGIYVTDGFSSVRWDLDQNFMLEMEALGASPFNILSCILVNDQYSKNVMMFYGYDTQQKVLAMSYSQRHLKSGPRFKLGFPWDDEDTSPRSAASFQLNDGRHFMLVGDEEGYIQCYPGKELADYGARARALSITTRMWNPEDKGQEYRLDDIYLLQQYGIAATITTYSHRTDTDTTLTKERTTQATTFSKVHPYILCEYMHHVITYPENVKAFPIELTLRYDDQFGEEER